MSFSMQSLECGLLFIQNNIKAKVPLSAVEIRTKVVEFVAEVTVCQKYVNRESNPIETIYKFPIEEEAAVVNFEAIIDGRTIKTQIKKKEEARQTYDQAMSEHRTAVLLEETTPEIFLIKLGQLKPGEGAVITLVYISELPVEGKAVRLTIPTTIAPRYVPSSDDSEAAKVISSIPYSKDSQSPLIFALEVLSQSKIRSIASPGHKLDIKIGDVQNENGQFEAKATFAGKSAEMNRDLVVLIENSQVTDPVVFIEKSEDPMIAAMVSLVPSFQLKEQPAEIIFLVDRSGSMGPGYSGNNNGSIEHAKTALELFLHSLPMDCFFNICSFGSRFDFLFSGSQRYDDLTLNKAKEHVASMAANYGGTEIYQPLNAIFRESRKPGHLRQIFVLTDGEVSNATQVIELVKKNNQHGRIFALGLGASASRHLVKGIARAGGGTASFATDGEDLRPKVMSQLKNALQPAISEVTVTWNGRSEIEEVSNTKPEVETQRTLLGYNKPKISKAQNKILQLSGQAPFRIQPIYDGSRLLVYQLFSEKDNTVPQSVTITAATPDGPLSVQLPIDKSCWLSGNFVHQLAARKRIQDLQETVVDGEQEISAEEVEQAIVQLGLRFKLASKHTSFVGVDDKMPNRLFEMEMMTREIENQVPMGFGAPFGMAAPGLNFSQKMIPHSFGVVKSCAPSGFQAHRRMAPSMPMMDATVSYGVTKGCSSPINADEADSSSMVATDSIGPSYGRVKSSSFQPEMYGTVKSASAHNDDEDSDEDDTDDDDSGFQDKLSRLVRLQAADGHFIWNVVIANCYGMTQQKLMAASPSYASEEVWITALVVAILEEMLELKDLWELVVKKARKYLEKKIAVNEIEKLIHEASSMMTK